MQTPDDKQASSSARDAGATTTVEIVVISLLKSTERRRRIEAVFETSGLNWSYFDAHTSLQHPGLQYDPEHVQTQFGRTLSGPEIGICSSHVAVLDGFIKRESSDYVLVLEDDVIFDTDFPIEDFSAFCAAKRIHYMRLFAKQYANAVQLGYFFDRHIIRYTTSPVGAQAYLMSRSGARSFIESFRSIDQPLDLALDAFWRSRLPIYSIFPFPIIERYSPSSNLIPCRGVKLDTGKQLTRLCHRVINKARKSCANLALVAEDRRMKRDIGEFRQIFAK